MAQRCLGKFDQVAGVEAVRRSRLGWFLARRVIAAGRFGCRLAVVVENRLLRRRLTLGRWFVSRAGRTAAALGFVVAG